MIGWKNNLMRRFTAPLLLVTVALWVGCTGTLTPGSPLVHETGTALLISPSSTTRAAPTPTVTRPMTPTPLPPSPTPAVTSTPTIPPEARLTIQCLDVAPTLPPQAASAGIVILDGHVGASLDTFLLDMATGAATLLTKPNENLINVAVSPDRERMAYNRILFDVDGPSSKVIEDKLVIATAEGQVQKAILWEQGWVGITGWLDDERLIINMAGHDPDESTRKKADTLLMLDLFTGQRRILRPDFPQIYDTYPVLEWEGWSETVYDPTLTRVVYPGPGYVLWDLEVGHALATLVSNLLHPPRWSPDGAQFVVAADPTLGEESLAFELFSVSRDGQTITQLTHLKAYDSDADMWGYSWSPDGRQLAFWLSTDSRSAGHPDTSTPRRLAVLDLVTQDVTDYCLPLDEYGELGTIPIFWEGLPSPLWSPNGQQLIVESRYDRDASRVILVDLVQGFAAQVAENMQPVGWIKASP